MHKPWPPGRSQTWLLAVASALVLAVVATLLIVVTRDPSPQGVEGAWDLSFQEEFDGDELSAERWRDHEPWQGQGWSDSEAWYPVPATQRQLSISSGRATLKARRGGDLPDGKAFTSVDLSTRGTFSLPEGATSFTEARLKAPTAAGLLPAFWLLGDGTQDNGGGWPLTGEMDILEFANNVDEVDRPYSSVWYPADVYTNPPGTFLNGAHDTHPESFAPDASLRGSWHTWGLYRSPERMDVYIDGARRFTFLPGQEYQRGIPLPDMLFTEAAHVRLSLGVGGDWAGAGRDAKDYEEGELEVEYVRSWVAD